MYDNDEIRLNLLAYIILSSKYVYRLPHYEIILNK